jgi:hypothetical protein
MACAARAWQVRGLIGDIALDAAVSSITPTNLWRAAPALDWPETLDAPVSSVFPPSSNYVGRVHPLG